VACESYKGEESVRPLVFWFAVGKAGKSAESSPVCRARISVVSGGQRLCGKGAKQLWKDDRVFEPGLEIAGTRLDHGAGIEAVAGELCERGFGEIVEGGVAMLSRWTDVDMRTACIAVFEESEPRENSLRGYAVQTWEHTSIAQHANIVERRFYGCEHVAD